MCAEDGYVNLFQNSPVFPFILSRDRQKTRNYPKSQLACNNLTDFAQMSEFHVSASNDFTGD